MRQQKEYLASLPNIWDPAVSQQAQEAPQIQRADNGGRGGTDPEMFAPGTEGLLGRQYTEVRPVLSPGDSFRERARF